MNSKELVGFAPCPTCKQYSHTIGEDHVSLAFRHFKNMISHRGDGIPTQYAFDEATRDAANVLVARIEAFKEEAETQRSVIYRLNVDSDKAAAELAKAVEGLEFYAKWHEQPSEGPWGADSRDFGDVARKTIKELRP